MKIEENGIEDQEMKARIAKGSQKYGILRLPMRSKFVSRRIKERIYRTVSRARAVDACEKWVLKKSDEGVSKRRKVGGEEQEQNNIIHKSTNK